MTLPISIPTALCLPTPDITALIQGRIIAAIPQMFMRPGQRFALYPLDSSQIPFTIDKYYCPNFLPIAQSIDKRQKSQQIFNQSKQLTLVPENKQLQLPLSTEKKVFILAWAECELCKAIDINHNLDSLSKLTIWTKEVLEKILHQRQHIFLSYLRVYKLSRPYEVSLKKEAPKLGKFVGLPNYLSVFQSNPVLSDNTFNNRKHQLENLEPPTHLELEEFLSLLSPLAIKDPYAKQLEQDIQAFLGWNTKQLNPTTHPELAWINQIAALGNRSKKQDQGKSNYQAGTDFENVVRQSLKFLGFTVDEFHKGGAGGVDLFCSHPYPLVIECKAGKKIPNDTAVQLLNLGTLRLKSQELFKQATKLIIGPGQSTKQLQEAAKVHNMAIINPETLEKLVKLQSRYHNSIDLFKLQDFLKAGQSDMEVEKYIVQVEEEIKLRSHLVQLVKNYLQNSKMDSAGVDSLHGVYFGSQPSKPLGDREMHDILIELSSPLTGYLGKIKGKYWKDDKFYFIRDLVTE